MKRYMLLIIVMILSASFLAGCAKHNTYIQKNYATENWPRNVDTDPSKWARGADSWFLTGDPNGVELANKQAPYSAAMSTMVVRVPNFTNIRVNGNFQVQLFGTPGPNSVYAYGPNSSITGVSIQVRGNTLCLDQIQPTSRSMKRLIIRIGVHQLNKLTQMGSGCIEGVQIYSNSLVVTSTPGSSGTIYLGGNMRLRAINQGGASSINIFGANSSDLVIRTGGSGCVNVSGCIGLKSIVHHGSANINVIGSTASGPLNIYADGSGKIGINGPVNIARIDARENTCVYAYPVTSNGMTVCVDDNARVGLAGMTSSLSVATYKNARFDGRYLCVQEIYAKAYDASHINISGNSKVFASSNQNSSIYFYGSPGVLTQFTANNGVIFPMGASYGSSCMIGPRPVYKGEESVRYGLGERRAFDRK